MIKRETGENPVQSRCCELSLLRRTHKSHWHIFQPGRPSLLRQRSQKTCRQLMFNSLLRGKRCIIKSKLRRTVLLPLWAAMAWSVAIPAGAQNNDSIADRRTLDNVVITGKASQKGCRQRLPYVYLTRNQSYALALPTLQTPFTACRE